MKEGDWSSDVCSSDLFCRALSKVHQLATDHDMVSKTDEAEESDKPIKKSDIDQLITAIPGRQVSQKLEERWSEMVEAGKNINCPCKVTISGPSGSDVYRFFDCCW